MTEKHFVDHITLPQAWSGWPMKHIFLKLMFCTLGALIGLFVFSVAREVITAFKTELPGAVISQALSNVGSLRWVDSDLIGAFIALAAAFIGVRGIQAQIKSSEQAVARQLEHADRLENDRRIAKHEAALAVLPVSLSLLIDTSHARAASIRTCIEMCVGEILPHGRTIPNFAPVPSQVIGDLKEVIEFSDAAHRSTYRRLLLAMQVQTARLTALTNYDRDPSWSVFRNNLIAYLVGEAEIYAISAQIYKAAKRNVSGPLPNLTRRKVASGLFGIGIYDHLKDEIIEKYHLDTDGDYPIR